MSRRVFWAALEKDISKIERSAMAQFFDSTCAYCGDALKPRWHADHIVSIDQGGFNHVSNRVPACARCNGNEKRERNWEEFLRHKCGTDQQLFNKRQQRILDWQATQAFVAEPVSAAAREAWRTEVKAIAIVFDDAWQRLKRIRDAKS